MPPPLASALAFATCSLTCFAFAGASAKAYLPQNSQNAEDRERVPSFRAPGVSAIHAALHKSIWRGARCHVIIGATIMARLPPLSSMETFLEVARHGTVKAAASELGLSMPALSRRIQTLEHAVGRPLFNRHHHGLRLTRSEEHTSELQSLMRISY